jgi:hypothetical protein
MEVFMNKKSKNLEKKSFVIDAQLKFEIARAGDALAKKMGYKDLRGMDAIIRYLCDKHHWFPHDARRLTVEDLLLLLSADKSLALDLDLI